MHTAKARTATGPDAAAADPNRLLERIASPANLASALLHVASNKGAAGVDGQSVSEVVAHAPRLLALIRRELLSATYSPGDIRRAWIKKPGGGRRGLGIPNVVDRWVQAAPHQVLEPILNPGFHDSSHGYRTTRGAETALADVRRHLADGLVWLVNIDLSNFFDEVNHQRLLARLARRVEDKRVLALIHRTLKAKVAMPNGVRVPSTQGTPQGGPLSPLLSNVVLDELDWELERRGLRFVRYADDFVVFVRSERAAHGVMASVTRYIEKRLRLEVNRDKSTITGPDDTHFLGFRFELQPGGEMEVHLSTRSIDRLKARITELTPRNVGKSLTSIMADVSQYFRGWMSHFRLLTGDGAQLLHRHDAHVRRRLRAIIIRHKRRDRHLYRHLRARGVSHKAAHGTAYRRRGFWKRSLLPGMHLAYPNRWFAERLRLLHPEWERLQPKWPASGQLLLFTD
jgi:group II intron reverse transcriptase/maturase